MPGPPYERLPNESEQAYRAFLTYRDMGANRAVTEAYRQSRGKPGAKQATGRWNKWAIDFRWDERAKAWDDHLQAERDEVARAEVRKWEARRLRRIEQNYEQGQRLRQKAEEILAMSLVKKVKEEVSPDGKTRTIILLPVGFRHKDAATMLGAADEMERQAIAEALPGSSPESIPQDIDIPEYDDRFDEEGDGADAGADPGGP